MGLYLDRTSLRALLWPTLSALAALAVLIGLGTWQLHRKTWKEGLLAQIAERTQAAPVDLAVALQRRGAGEDIEYLRVRVRGRFDHEKERYFYATGREGPGAHVYTPLTLPDDRVVLVNRGYVPDALKERSARPKSLVAGEVEVTGLVRAPGMHGMFVADNDVAHNLWYWRDLDGMAASMLGSDKARVAPVFLDAEESANAEWPRGGTTQVTLPNRHLEYAVTWFGLGVALIGVYSAFVVSRLSRPGAPGG
jgi:surfeit locus 1 family protein